MTTRPINTQLQIIDLKTGAMTREGFNLFHQIREDVSNPNLVDLSNFTSTGFLVHDTASSFQARQLDNASAGITFINPDGVGGNPKPVLTNDLKALEDLSGLGIAVRTGGDNWEQRAIDGTSNQISVTNADGVAANPKIGLSVGDIVTGAYTPSITNGANVSASASVSSFYVRIGDRVMVWGIVAITPTVIDTATEISISIPVASNLGAGADCMGVAATRDILSSGGIDADSATDRARLRFISKAVTSNEYHYSFGYKVI